MVLNRNPKNYFAEVEQIAFSPIHMVPGIEPSPDKMLQVSAPQPLLIQPRQPPQGAPDVLSCRLSVVNWSAAPPGAVEFPLPLDFPQGSLASPG